MPSRPTDLAFQAGQYAFDHGEEVIGRTSYQEAHCIEERNGNADGQRPWKIYANKVHAIAVLQINRKFRDRCGSSRRSRGRASPVRYDGCAGVAQAESIGAYSPIEIFEEQEIALVHQAYTLNAGSGDVHGRSLSA